MLVEPIVEPEDAFPIFRRADDFLAIFIIGIPDVGQTTTSTSQLQIFCAISDSIGWDATSNLIYRLLESFCCMCISLPLLSNNEIFTHLHIPLWRLNLGGSGSSQTFPILCCFLRCACWTLQSFRDIFGSFRKARTSMTSENVVYWHTSGLYCWSQDEQDCVCRQSVSDKRCERLTSFPFVVQMSFRHAINHELRKISHPCSNGSLW